MNSFLSATITLTVLLGTYALVLTPRIPYWRGLLGVFSLAALVALSFFGFSDMLGRPKPVRLDAFNEMAGGSVLSSMTREGVGIYLWVRPPADAEPRYFMLPWDKKTAEDLQHAQEEAQRSHGGVGLRYQHSWDKREPMFYALPQPALPPKGGQAPPAQVTGPERGA